MIKHDVLNRWTNDVQFTAEIDCAEDSPHSVKIGLAVKWGVKSGADLRGANLSDADPSGAPFKIPNIHQAIYEAASQPNALDMSNWHHSCGTTHCRAGWAVTLAGDAGRTLEWAYGTPSAAALIYLASDPEIGKMPDFYCDNEIALADMKARADAEAY